MRLGGEAFAPRLDGDVDAAPRLVGEELVVPRFGGEDWGTFPFLTGDVCLPVASWREDMARTPRSFAATAPPRMVALSRRL